MLMCAGFQIDQWHKALKERSRGKTSAVRNLNKKPGASICLYSLSLLNSKRLSLKDLTARRKQKIFIGDVQTGVCVCLLKKILIRTFEVPGKNPKSLFLAGILSLNRFLNKPVCHEFNKNVFLLYVFFLYFPVYASSSCHTPIGMINSWVVADHLSLRTQCIASSMHERLLFCMVEGQISLCEQSVINHTYLQVI